jgi:hypothetical protein
MTAAAFLVIAIGVTVCGTYVLWVRSRAVHTVTGGVDEFKREMNALAPDGSKPASALPGVTARPTVHNSRLTHPTAKVVRPEGWVDGDDDHRLVQ